MSVEEMKAEMKRIVDGIEDEKLLEKNMDILENVEPRPTIEEMYAEVVGQYANTLRKLAQ